MAQAPTELNWIDPDIAAYNEEVGVTAVFTQNEQVFKQFFEETWQEPRFDRLRERWDRLLHDSEPIDRVMAKTALWSVVRLRCLDIDALIAHGRQS